MTLTELRTKYREDILRLADEYGMSNVRVFGSVVRGEADEDSDIDFLAKLAPKTSLLKFISFQRNLKELLKRKVDVLSEKGVNKYLKSYIFEEAEEL